MRGKMKERNHLLKRQGDPLNSARLTSSHGKGARDLLAGAIIAVMSVLAAGVASAADAGIALEDYAKAGTLIRLPSGRALNIRCIGAGSTTVVLTAGAGEQSLTWRAFQGELSKSSRVCAWDRAGFGFSDPSAEVQDTDHTTNDLEALLAGAKIRPKYLLVGHSLGGYETLMFAFRHPKDVAGIVLFDPSAPFQNRRLKTAAPATYEVFDTFQQKQLATLKSCIDWLGSQSHESEVRENCLSPPESAYPDALNKSLARWERNAAAQKDMLSLLDGVFTDQDSKELERARTHLGSMPLIVLTAGTPPPIPLKDDAMAQLPALQAEWSKLHDEIASLSTHGANRKVPGAGHYIYLDRPEVALAAVREVLAAVNH